MFLCRSRSEFHLLALPMFPSPSQSEGDVTAMMAAFMQMRAQMINVSRMMKLNTAEGGARYECVWGLFFPNCALMHSTGQQDEKLMKELVESAGKKVSSGMVRRKKEKGPMLKPKGFGFGAPAAAASKEKTSA